MKIKIIQKTEIVSAKCTDNGNEFHISAVILLKELNFEELVLACFYRIKIIFIKKQPCSLSFNDLF